MIRSFIIILLTVFALSASAQSVDVQFNICDDIETISKALDLDSIKRKERRTYLFDTKSLGLFAKDLIVRLRVEDDGNELTLKLYNLSRKEFESLIDRPDCDCEYDDHGDKKTPTCSIIQELDESEVRALLKDPTRLPEVLNAEQNKALERHGVTSSHIANLQKGGPIREKKWKLQISKDLKKVSIDFARTTPERSYIQFSMKTESDSYRDDKAEFAQWIGENNFRLCKDQDRQRKDKLRDVIGGS